VCLASVAVVATLLVFLISLPTGISAAAATNPPVNVTLHQGDLLQIDASPTVNVSGVSVTGGWYKYLTQAPGPTTTEILLVPLNTTTYSMSVTFAGGNSSYNISITKVSAATSQVANYSEPAGALTQLVLKITVLPSANAVSPQSSWDPWFGFAPIRVGGVDISFANVIEGMFAVSVVLIGIGVYFKNKISYLGGFLLVFALIAVIGFFPLLAFLLVYIIGYGAVSLAWKLRHFQQRPRGGPV
jgi:hypothetical protein